MLGHRNSHSAYLLSFLWPKETAAVCVYMVTHLLGQSRSFGDVVRVAGFVRGGYWESIRRYTPIFGKIIRWNGMEKAIWQAPLGDYDEVGCELVGVEEYGDSRWEMENI